jgi:uncharacterized protein
MVACNTKCCTVPVRMLLAQGADPALQTSTGEAALHTAAMAGRADVCKMLLEAGCNPDVRNSSGVTPLVRAVDQGHMQVVELLHKQWGAELSMTDSDGGTLLHLTAATGQRRLIEYLVQNGVDVNAATREAVTPLRIALQMGNAAAAQTLLEHDADTTVVDTNGDNLLIEAVREGLYSVVEQLLHKQTIDVNATTANGGTTLHIAAFKDRTDAAALLLQHGAAVDTPAVNGSTPLLVAATFSSAELVQLLLDAGADVTARHIVGVTALHSAAENSKHPEVLQLLLQHSHAAAMLDTLADECDCCGKRTAVMICDQPAHLKLLLAAGADVHVTTDRGNTALHVAAVHKHPAPVLCLLIKAGVDLHAVNNDGKTAAQVAAESGNTLAAALLTRAARDT